MIRTRALQVTMRERARKDISIENFLRSRFERKKGLGRQFRELFFGSVGLGEPQNFFGLNIMTKS